MNKQEKIISLAIGILLVWCFFRSGGEKKEQPREEAPAAAVAQERETPAAPAEPAAVAQERETPAAPKPDEQTVEIGDANLMISVTTWGASVKKARLPGYAKGPGDVSDSNPALEFDYSPAPLGALSGIPSIAHDAPYEIVEKGDRHVVLKNAYLTRRISVGDGYKVSFDDVFADGVPLSGENRLSVGVMSMGPKDNDTLGIDTWKSGDKGGGVVHHDDDDTTVKPLLAGATPGGCSCGGSDVQGLPPLASAEDRSPVEWLALKDRFFVTALTGSSEKNQGFSATVVRDPSKGNRLSCVTASIIFSNAGRERHFDFFLGPKKQSVLWDLGMKDVMEFGMWRWICYPVVWLLETFHRFVPVSYGWAVVFLTVLVRLLFWPLTRKSTEGMRKMQEIQPLMKEIQAKYKDNPQRLQQETWALYREKKVNPLSSCLPMLVQIPVFIALFNVLRSAVELRYAPFLWIGDLSEPEHLFASWFPFGGLNILPLLMALTMYLQSKLTPTAGDQSQQRMMTVFMPLMMLVMFYNFASALSLYWTLSQVLSIVQMYMIRRETKAAETVVVEPPVETRQMRRHGN